MIIINDMLRTRDRRWGTKQDKLKKPKNKKSNMSS